MRTVLLALAAGAVAAAVLGGRVGGARASVRQLDLLALGLGLQVVPAVVAIGEAAATAMVLVGYAFLLWFALGNLQLVGMPVAVAGVALNAAVVGLNQGMPVRPEAVEAAGGTVDLDDDLGPQRHWAGGGDHLTVLGDAIPVPPLGEVVSFGDLVLAAGVADVAFRLVRPRADDRRSVVGS